MDRPTLERFLDDKNRTQRERLRLLTAEWLPSFARMDDGELLACLRLIRKTINSKKLKADVDALIGELRRDGSAAADPLPKPTVGDTPEPVVVADSAALAPTRNPELEETIAKDPRAREAKLVYRDWLESRGLVADGRVALGPLSECDDMLSEVDWHLGFIRRCRLSYSMERFNGDRPRCSIEQALEWLLDDPGAGRLVEDLTIGLALHDDNDYAGVCGVIGDHLRLALEKLHIGDFGYEDCELNWSRISDASPLWPALPRLRELTLRAGEMRLGEIVLPELRRFETISGGLDDVAARSIATARWPKLEILSVQLGPQGASDPATLQPILEAKGLPNLRYLGLPNCNFSDAICERLPSSKILAQLEVLDLSMGTLGIESARFIHEHRAAFAHLKRLDVDDNYLPAEALGLLEGVCMQVSFGDQRDDGGDPGRRYASAYE